MNKKRNGNPIDATIERSLPRRGSHRTHQHSAGDKIRYLVITGVIAGLYTALTLVLAPISYGLVQCRLSEALTILAAYTPAAIPGLTIGCALANLLGGSYPLDILVGTFATFLAAWLSYRLGRIRWVGLPVLATIPPVVCNAVIIGVEMTLLLGPRTVPTLLLWMGSVGLGQVIACVGGGLLLAYSFKKSGFDRKLTSNSFTDR